MVDVARPIRKVRYGFRGLTGAQGATGPQGPPYDFDSLDDIVYLATGESNLVLNRLYDWSPPSNMKVWNNDNGAAQTVGTAFVAPDPTHIGGAAAYVAEFARAYPLQRHWLINVSMGGRSIAAWIGGFDYTWDSDTAETDPGSGVVKINAANNKLIISHIDGHDTDRKGQLLWWEAGTHIRIESVADPTDYIDFTTDAAVVDQGTWETVTGSVTGSSGVIAEGPVKFRVYPDMWETILANMAVALPQLNVTKINQLIWWQSGNDSPFQLQNTPNYFYEQYGIDFETWAARLKTQDWFDPRTPMIVWGMVSEETGGLTNYRVMNNRLQRVVQADPENRIFVYHNLSGPLYWEPISGFPDFAVHMTALGLALYGYSSAHAVLDRMGRNMPAGIAIDAENQNVYLERGSMLIGEMSIAPERSQMREAGGSNLRAIIQSEGDAQMRVARFSNDSTAPSLQMRKYRGGLIENVVVNASDVLGQLLYLGFDGTIPRISAELRATVQAAVPSVTDMETRVAVFACGPGSIAETEIARFSVAAGLSMFGANSMIDANRHFRTRLYTTGTLPAIYSPAGQVVYDTTVGECVFTSGTAWLKFSDRSQVAP